MDTAIPVPLSNATPVAEATAAAGSIPAASKADHVHPRLSSASNVTLDSTGHATVTFTRTFTAEPVPILTPIATGSNQPTVVEVESWVTTGSLYTGAVIRALRSTTLPTLSTSLLGLNVFLGTTTGTKVGCVFLQPS